VPTRAALATRSPERVLDGEPSDYEKAEVR
jgi:hypothetical protein